MIKCVSPEVAILARQYGFDVGCLCWLNIELNRFHMIDQRHGIMLEKVNYVYNFGPRALREELCAAPTHLDLNDWFRINHKLCISIDVQLDGLATWYIRNYNNTLKDIHSEDGDAYEYYTAYDIAFKEAFKLLQTQTK